LSQSTKLGAEVEAVKTEMFGWCVTIKDGEGLEVSTITARRLRISRRLSTVINLLEKQVPYHARDGKQIEVTHLTVGKNANLTWTQACERVEADAESISGRIDCSTLLCAGHVIQKSGTVSLATLLGVVGRGCSDNTKATMLSLILLYFPVGALGCDGVDLNCVIVDLKSGAGFETVTERLKGSSTLKKGKASGKKRGRKPIDVKVEGLVAVVVDIVKANAPEASAKRRHEIINTGISLGNLLKAVRERIPAFTADKRTLARLMCPPNQGRKSSSAYKQLVNAKITSMQNDLKVTKEDAHYSCAQVSLLKELLAWIGGAEATLVSCDEKAQLVIGEAGLVSR
jgi:hypothetical protein